MRVLYPLLLMTVFSCASLVAAASDQTFERLAHDCIEYYLTTHPEGATVLGDHRFDDRLTDYSADALDRELQQVRRELEALRKIDVAQLSGLNRIDAQILRVQLEQREFELAEEKAFTWDPLRTTPAWGRASIC